VKEPGPCAKDNRAGCRETENDENDSTTNAMCYNCRELALSHFPCRVGRLGRIPISPWMKTQINFAPGPGLKVTSSELRAGTWLVRIVGLGRGKCPDCGYPSVSRHSGYVRSLRDLPIQGSPVRLEVSLSRLRCRQQTCPRATFVEPAGPELERFARMTHRVQDLVVMTGHTAGGRPAQSTPSGLD
jgi:hypothetical protein